MFLNCCHGLVFLFRRPSDGPMSLFSSAFLFLLVLSVVPPSPLHPLHHTHCLIFHIDTYYWYIGKYSRSVFPKRRRSTVMGKLRMLGSIFLSSASSRFMPNHLLDPHAMPLLLFVPTALPFVSPRRTLHRLAEK